MISTTHSQDVKCELFFFLASLPFFRSPRLTSRSSPDPFPITACSSNFSAGHKAYIQLEDGRLTPSAKTFPPLAPGGGRAAVASYASSEHLCRGLRKKHTNIQRRERVHSTEGEKRREKTGKVKGTTDFKSRRGESRAPLKAFCCSQAPDQTAADTIFSSPTLQRAARDIKHLAGCSSC